MNLTLELILLLALVLLAGLAIGYLWARFSFQRSGMTRLKTNLAKSHVSRDLHENLVEDRNRLIKALEEKEHLILDAHSTLAAKDTTLAHLEEKLRDQKNEIQEMQTHFRLEFEKMARDILKTNTKEFAESNQKQISDILSPLKEKLSGFEKKVEDTYDKESKDRSHLKGEIKQLMELNQRISQEARELAVALKGDQKQQGNWGELILDRILERSGLRKGEEYQTQQTELNHDGRRIKPDVIIHLPDKKHIIIDAKVSLTAYERFVNAVDDSKRTGALKQHLASIRSHIRGLANKNYPSASGLRNPDFVLMFIPIESSFSLAVQEDKNLFHFAWDRKIVIVSPSTLLATLRTVASLWKQEKQTRNALEIARQAGALYDKFVGFVEDLQKIDQSLDQSRKAYDAALNKLQTGRGNLIGRSEKIRKLGIKTRKKLTRDLVENAVENGLEEEE